MNKMYTIGWFYSTANRTGSELVKRKCLRAGVLVSVEDCFTKKHKHLGLNSGKIVNVGFLITQAALQGLRVMCRRCLRRSFSGRLSDGTHALESPASFKTFWSSAAGRFCWPGLWWFDVSTRLKLKSCFPTNSQQQHLLAANKIDGNSWKNEFLVLV